MVWLGFELHPETPRGGMPLSQIVPAARRSGMVEQMQRFAASFGVTGMKFAERIPNTRRVLAVAEFARENGRLEAFRTAAMEAWWRRGDDLESDTVLQALAREAGLDDSAVADAADDPRLLARIDAIREDANARGITGVPTFIVKDRWAVVGCQPYAVLAEVVARAGGVAKGAA